MGGAAWIAHATSIVSPSMLGCVHVPICTLLYPLISLSKSTCLPDRLRTVGRRGLIQERHYLISHLSVRVNRRRAGPHGRRSQSGAGGRAESQLGTDVQITARGLIGSGALRLIIGATPQASFAACAIIRMHARTKAPCGRGVASKEHVGQAATEVGLGTLQRSPTGPARICPADCSIR